MIEDLQFSWISRKISAETVALSIVDAMRKRKPIVIIPSQARLLLYVNVFLPLLGDRLARYFQLEGRKATKDQM
jgi:hypothetical protein